MTKYQQTRDELIGHLKNQISFMKLSSLSYDSGCEYEAKRLAVAIRILVHDTSASKSLLASLNKKDVKFYDSANPYEPRNLLTYNGLTMMRLSTSEGGSYVAPLDGGPPTRSKPRRIRFKTWWEGVFVVRDKDKKTFTRKDLILNTANTDGGTHIDPSLNEAYANLSRFNSLGWKVFKNNVEDRLNSPVLASIRQITHEVLKTLRDESVDLFPRDDDVWAIFKDYEEHCRQVQK